MKIVHVLPALAKGGAERVVVDLANLAAANGDSVAVVAAFYVSADLLLCDLRDDVEVRYVDASAHSTRRAYFKLVPWLIRNREWILSHDIIHCHLSFGGVFGTATRLLGRKAGSRRPAIVETYHAVGMQIPKIHRALHAAMLQHRDAIALMAEDSFWQRFLRKQRMPVAIIPNGVRPTIAHPEHAKREAYRVESKIPAGVKIIGTVSRLVPDRRPELLLKVFAQVAKLTEDNVHFLLAGEGSKRAEFEAEVSRLGLRDRVHTPGLVLKPESAFSVIDIYVTLNVGPITGIAGLEAATFGLPIVALQLLDNYSGAENDWIWSSSNPEKVSYRIVELLDAPEQQRALANRQRQHALSFYSADAMAASYSKLYRAALEQPGREHKP